MNSHDDQRRLDSDNRDTIHKPMRGRWVKIWECHCGHRHQPNPFRHQIDLPRRRCSCGRLLPLDY